MAKVMLSVTRPVLVVMVAATFLLGTPFADSQKAFAETTAQTQAKLRVACEFLDVAEAKFAKGMHESAETMIAQLESDYYDVLTSKEMVRIKQLKDQISKAKSDKATVEAGLTKSSELIETGKYNDAMQILAQIQGCEYIADNQKQQILSNVALAQKKIREQEMEMKHLFTKSIQEYKAGNTEAALEGFQTVQDSGVAVSSWGKDSAYYINRINNSEASDEAVAVNPEPKPVLISEPAASNKVEARPASSAVKLVKVTKAECAEAENNPCSTPAVADPVARTAQSSEEADDSYVKVIESKRNRQRDYTRAIVNDSIAKAEGFIAECDFAKARSSLTIAYANIEKGKMLLGDSIYNNYKDQLDQLSARIEQSAEQKRLAEADQQRVETEKLQKNIRSKMEEQRLAAVKDYMQNAFAFQKEQRYEEALAQIEALLAIDPLNQMALMERQALKDILVWREQHAIQKERHEQELKTLLEADRAAVPYNDEITFPKNWKELVSRRKSDQEQAVDPENFAIYRQMDQIVDLTMLTEDTGMAEAIEIVRNSVDPTLTVVVRWRDLEENAYIEQSTPINVSIPGKIKLKAALDIILGSVSGGFAEIDYAVEDGVVIVATVEALPDQLEARQYDVSELLGVPASFSFESDTSEFGNQGEGRGGGGGSSRRSSDSSDSDLGDVAAAATQQAEDIRQLIQDSVDPDSWYDAGGTASIQVYAQSRLIIRQTVENHEKIEELLNGLRSTIGQQVAIEARFLIVTENFLERIGIDIDAAQNLGSKWGTWVLEQNHDINTYPSLTGVPGSLADNFVSAIAGQYGNLLLDDLEVSIFIDLIQSHRDSRTLNAPKISVLNGESAAIRVVTDKSYVSDYDFEEITSSGDNQPIRIIADPDIASLSDGVILNVSPTITADKKYVLLRIVTSFTNTSFADFAVPSGGETSQDYIIQLPESQIADVRTRVTVPDGGTLLIGGQKLTAETNTEEGLPILNKIPILGRLFENRGEIKDSSILLILVKPTILIQDELEEDAVAAMK